MPRQIIIDAIRRIVGDIEINLETPEIGEYGDYSTNVALQAFQRLATSRPGVYVHKWPSKVSGKSSQEMAGNIKELLEKDKELLRIVSKIEVAGPGFINFWLSPSALVENLGKIVEKKNNYGSSDLGKGKTAVIEYSSPNVAKRFGIGHLRSTVIGQALYNLYRFLGNETVGDNHIGDWGTQFGALLYQIDSKGLSPEKLTVSELETLYVEFNSEAGKDEKLWESARAYFKKLEEGDPKIRELWKSLVAISQKEFDRIYELLGVKIENSYGESFYEDRMPKVIEEVRGAKLSRKSEGVEIVEFKDLPPAMLVKSDGATTYFTRDLATINFRIEKWNPDVIIYEVGSDQILHFRQVFATAKLLGWNDKIHYEHVAHGLIRLPAGKMSTRRGETVKLEDVLTEAIARAREIIDKSETGRGLGDSEKDSVAKAVGIGAVKYFDLMHHPKTDIIFNWDNIFVLEGNSAPYLQYTVARSNSVLAKSKRVKGQESRRLETGNWKLEINAEELLVLRSLSRFSDVIVSAAKNYSPNLLANYLFDLAQKYNNFYNQHRIIGGENEEFRIGLTVGAGQVLKNGLRILGIDTPVKM